MFQIWVYAALDAAAVLAVAVITGSFAMVWVTGLETRRSYPPVGADHSEFLEYAATLARHRFWHGVLIVSLVVGIGLVESFVLVSAVFTPLHYAEPWTVTILKWAHYSLVVLFMFFFLSAFYYNGIKSTFPQHRRVTRLALNFGIGVLATGLPLFVWMNLVLSPW